MSRKPSSIGIGFSHHSVPSLSYTAIRSDGGTYSAPPSSVTRSTKSTIARLGAESRQLGRCPPMSVAREGGRRLAGEVDERVVHRAARAALARCAVVGHEDDDRVLE